jgi:hypothetical protein
LVTYGAARWLQQKDVRQVERTGWLQGRLLLVQRPVAAGLLVLTELMHGDRQSRSRRRALQELSAQKN